MTLLKEFASSFTKLAIMCFVVMVVFAGCIINRTIINENEEITEEPDTPMPQYNNNVGFTASSISGVGLHYKRFITPEHSAKVVIGGWQATEEYSSNDVITKKSDDTYFSAGLEYRYSFLRENKGDFYALAGLRTWYSEYTNPKDLNYNREINNINAVGLGLGYEFRLSKHVVMNIECGLTYNWELERQWRNTYNNEPLFERMYLRKITYAGGIGLGFVF